jgi:uncharacterized protein YhhL (DUF1145 family)
MFFGLSKLLLVVVYLAAPLSFFLEPLGPYSETLLMVVAILAVVHGLEIAMLKKRLQLLPGSGATHVVQTLMFGFLYWLPLFKKHGV